jgi:hypothetical protein
MRRSLLAVPVAAAALTVALAGPALADSPHFLKADASVSATTGALSAAFKDAGLGTGASSVAVTLTADASALYQCFNGGGNHPQAGNKQVVTAPVSATGDFPVRHGSTIGVITAGPPGAGTFACPNGQKLFLQSVSYTAITLSDATGNSTATTPPEITVAGIHIPA